MGKEEYINAIKKELGFMPFDEVVKAEKYFEAYFNGNEPDEKIIERLGTPKDAAQNYYRTHMVNNTQTSTQPKKSNISMWILIIVLVLLSPIIIPLAIAIGTLAVVLVIGLIILFPMMFLCGITMWLSGAGIIIKSIVLFDGIANMLLQIGIGFIMFGFGLLIAWFAVFICVKLFPWIIRKIVNAGSKIVHGGASK